MRSLAHHYAFDSLKLLGVSGSVLATAELRPFIYTYVDIRQVFDWVWLGDSRSKTSGRLSRCWASLPIDGANFRLVRGCGAQAQVVVASPVPLTTHFPSSAAETPA